MIRSTSVVAVLGLMLGAAPSVALSFENTVLVGIDPERQWQCGEGFFTNGGSEEYRVLSISADATELGTFDLADPAECGKTLEYVVDRPAGEVITIGVKAGTSTMASAMHTADRNRVWTVHVFVDTVWGELTTDYAPPRGAPSSALSSEELSYGHRNTINLRVAPGRQWQCGEGFFANGGSETYRYGHLTVDGEALPDFDFANPADCTRIESVTRDLADGESASIGLTVGPYTMGATLTARDWERTWTVNFFVDQIWGEVAEGSR